MPHSLFKYKVVIGSDEKQINVSRGARQTQAGGLPVFKKENNTRGRLELDYDLFNFINFL